MRIVAIGDLHLDAQLSGYDYHRDVLDRLYEVDVRAGDLVVQLGDVCDPDRGARTHRALEAFAAWARAKMEDGARVVVVTGNHDVTDDARCRSCLGVLRHAGLAVYERVGAVWLTPTENYAALWLPWLSPAHGSTDVLALARKAMDRHPGARFVAFAHLNVPGCTPGSEADMPRLGRLELPQALIDDERVERFVCGHVHRSQDLHGGRVHVVGSLECLGFGERDDRKGVTVLEL